MEKTALILCGGGSRGALQIGFYQALTELGVAIDLIVGVSVGAINGAFIAAGATPAELVQLWGNIGRRDLFGINPGLLWRPFASDALLSNHRLRGFLERHLPVRRFEDLNIPLTVVGTHLQTGEPVYFETGDLITPVMASCAMPGLLPPIDLGDRQIIDGGLSNNVPLDAAVARGADTVIGMLCICCEAIPYPVQGWVDNLTYSFSIAVDRKYRADLLHYRDQARLVMMEPRAGLDVGVMDFEHTDALIKLGYSHALKALERHGFGCGAVEI